MTLPYWLAVGYAALGGRAANDRLDQIRAWLVVRDRTTMGIICSVLGLVLVAKGGAAVQ